MIIADTGFWLALRNQKDRHHLLAKQSIDAHQEERLITTWPVMTETYYLLQSKLSTQDAIAFLELYRKNYFDLFPLDRDHAERMVKLCKKYSSLPMDLADASLVILAEHLGDGRIFSTDQRDFQAYRWKKKKPFQNLMLP